MPRARNIKHEFFKNEELAEVSFPARLLFIGLWTLADCKGRMQCRPKRIKAEIFPYDDVDVVKELSDLDKSGFITIYLVKNIQYIEIVNFEKHQNPHKNERAKGSDCPDPINGSQVPDLKGVQTNPDKSGQVPNENGTDPADSLLLNPDSLLLNPDTSPSKDGRVADKSASCYVFEGDTFRINQVDYCKHLETYPNLDLLAEYAQLDIELRESNKKQLWGTLNAKLNYRNKKSKPSNQQGRVSSMEAALMHNAAYAAQLEREIEQEALASHDEAMAMPQR